MAFYDTPGLTYDSGVFYDEEPTPQPIRKHMGKVKLGLARLGPDQVVALANTIKTAMTGNANFAAPNPTLVAVGTLITTATTKIAAYNTSLAATDTALSDRDAAVAALKAALTQEAAYVENVANGDSVKIESAGMGVRGLATPVGPLPQVMSLIVEPGANEGHLDVSWDPVYGAASYEVHTCTDPMLPANWTYKLTAAKSNADMNTFASGSRIWTRVRAIGADNAPGPWSDPAVKTVP